MAVDASDHALICRGGAWRLLNDRVGSVVSVATYSGAGVGSVPAPTCGAGGVADIALAPLETGADYGGAPPRNRFSLFPTWTGSAWTITPALSDSTGTSFTTSFASGAYTFSWMATTLCNYGAGN
jgi:hypothetical protein